MATRAPRPAAPKVPESERGDTVVVLAGKDAGKRGVVDQVIRRVAAPSASRWRLPTQSAAPRGRPRSSSKASTSRRSGRKPRQSAGANDRTPKIHQGGILEIAQPLPISRVMLVCPSCAKPTRIAHAVLDTGRRVRVCRHCGQQLEVKA